MMMMQFHTQYIFNNEVKIEKGILDQTSEFILAQDNTHLTY